MKLFFRSSLMCICLLSGALYQNASADELIYQPVNPAFGGNPLNGSMLMSTAQAQNNHKDPGIEERKTQSSLDRMISSLQSRLMSQLLSDIGSGETGTLVTDEFRIEVYQEPDGTAVVSISDFVTGETTVIEVNGISSGI